MAKLSAHGTELYRLELSKTDDNPDSLTSESRRTVSIRSDRKVLDKLDVRFKPDKYHPNGEWHSYGWKLYGKLKNSPEAARDMFVRKGYTVTHTSSFAAFLLTREVTYGS
jgi:hypothetical protein